MTIESKASAEWIHTKQLNELKHQVRRIDVSFYNTKAWNDYDVMMREKYVM